MEITEISQIAEFVYKLCSILYFCNFHRSGGGCFEFVYLPVFKDIKVYWCILAQLDVNRVMLHIIQTNTLALNLPNSEQFFAISTGLVFPDQTPNDA